MAATELPQEKISVTPLLGWRRKVQAWKDAHPKLAAGVLFLVDGMGRITGAIGESIVNGIVLAIYGAFLAQAVGVFVASGGLAGWVAVFIAYIGEDFNRGLGTVALALIYSVTALLIAVRSIQIGIHSFDKTEPDEVDDELLDKLDVIEKKLDEMNVGFYLKK